MAGVPSTRAHVVTPAAGIAAALAGHDAAASMHVPSLLSHTTTHGSPPLPRNHASERSVRTATASDTTVESAPSGVKATVTR